MHIKKNWKAVFVFQNLVEFSFGQKKKKNSRFDQDTLRELKIYFVT